MGEGSHCQILFSVFHLDSLSLYFHLFIWIHLEAYWSTHFIFLNPIRQAYLELYKYRETECFTVLHLKAHWQLISKFHSYLYSFLACYIAKWHEKLKEYSKQSFYQMWGLLHQEIIYLLCQAIIFFCSFLSLDTNISK